MPARKASPAALEQEREHEVRRADQERDEPVVDEDEAGPDEETEKSIEEERVRQSRAAVLEDAPVRQHVGEHAREAGPRRKADTDPTGRARKARRA